MYYVYKQFIKKQRELISYFQKKKTAKSLSESYDLWHYIHDLSLDKSYFVLICVILYT